MTAAFTSHFSPPHLSPFSLTSHSVISRWLACGVLLLPAPAQAQQDHSDLARLAARLAALSAVSGYEHAMVDTVLRLLPGGTRDRAGNARLQLGGGSVKRLVVCALDEPGYVVGNIRQDGYLTLRRTSGRVSALFDQQIEGQRVTIEGRGGSVPGVVAVRSIHLTRGRSAPSELPFTVDDAYVDVGAASRSQVTALGVRVLAPVTLAKRPHAYGNGLLAAPAVGRRTACAALVLAVGQSIVRAKLIPQVTVAFAVEQELSQRGLATLGNELGPFDETVLVDSRAGQRGALQQEPDSGATARWPRLGQVTRWSLPVRYAGTPVETVALADADSLRSALVRWIGGDR
jgi:putative aminopeptidase FrvX